MAPSLKTLLIFSFALTIWSFTISTKARPLMVDDNFRRTESNSLVTRLNLEGNSTSCWDSLFKLQACTGEVIQFFYNGEAYLGPECCHAVQVIVHDCWPDLLNSLGFTSEEGDVLRGYCDAEATRPGPNPPSPTHASVFPIKAKPIMEQD